jgi:hypothetical protein
VHFQSADSKLAEIMTFLTSFALLKIEKDFLLTVAFYEDEEARDFHFIRPLALKIIGSPKDLRSFLISQHKHFRMSHFYFAVRCGFDSIA